MFILTSMWDYIVRMRYNYGVPIVYLFAVSAAEHADI